MKDLLAACWADWKASAAYRRSGPRIGWRMGGDIRVSYGARALPAREDRAGGGIVKVLDLTKRFPDRDTAANILYLVSSSLPPGAAAMAREARRAGARVVLNQNGVAYPAWHGPGWRVTNHLLRKVLEQADHVVYQSAFCKVGADRYLGLARHTQEVLHNAVDTSVFLPRPNPRTGAAIALLVAGSHCQFYRIESALQTLAILRQEGVGARLLVAGRLAWRDDGARAQQELEAAARRLKVEAWVEILGPYSQAEAVDLFHRADILLHTQYNDSCPRLVLEAMACGVPVVYSSSGGTPELVGDTAGRGIPAPLDWERIHPPEPAALAAAVRAVVADHAVYARGARDRAVARFDVNPWLDRHGEVFSRLVMSPS